MENTRLGAGHATALSNPGVNECRGVFVHRWAMEDCDGNPRDAMVLSIIVEALRHRSGANRLLDRDGTTWLCATDDELARLWHLSSDQVYRARQALMRRGLIKCKRVRLSGRSVLITRPVVVASEDDFAW